MNLHSKQCEELGGAGKFGYHYFKEFKKANQSYRNNRLEREAYDFQYRFASSLDTQLANNSASIPEPPAQKACFDVDSRKGWQHHSLPSSFTRIASISGSWSVDDRNYRRVGSEGHLEPGLEPYNQYKYDKGYSFGALLVDIPTQSYGYIRASGAQQLPQPISQTSMRINDSDDSLGDNGGALNVCFGH